MFNLTSIDSKLGKNAYALKENQIDNLDTCYAVLIEHKIDFNRA